MRKKHQGKVSAVRQLAGAVCGLLLAAALTLGSGLYVSAATGELKTYEQDLTAYTEKGGTEVLAEYAAGSPILVTGEDDDYIYVSFLGDNGMAEGYIPKAGAADAAAAEEALDAAAIDAELQEGFEEQAAVAEAVERQTKQRRTRLIWGIVIGVLAVAIILINLIPVLKKGRQGGAAEDGESGEEKSGEERTGKEKPDEESGEEKDDADE